MTRTKWLLWPSSNFLPFNNTSPNATDGQEWYQFKHYPHIWWHIHFYKFWFMAERLTRWEQRSILPGQSPKKFLFLVLRWLLGFIPFLLLWNSYFDSSITVLDALTSRFYELYSISLISLNQRSIAVPFSNNIPSYLQTLGESWGSIWNGQGDLGSSPYSCESLDRLTALSLHFLIYKVRGVLWIPQHCCKD